MPKQSSVPSNAAAHAPKPAKTCYEHIGGKLGLLLLESFVKKGWIAKEHAQDKNYFIAATGEKEFAKLGIDITQIKSE